MKKMNEESLSALTAPTMPVSPTDLAGPGPEELTVSIGRIEKAAHCRLPCHPGRPVVRPVPLWRPAVRGKTRLVLGHESLGRVIDPGPSSSLKKGDLVVRIVRRPDPVPCPNCAVGE
jgi:D-arabinose 1-dehydrogenase-like Zn-dependent alcohol dehydrogenase